MSEETLSQIFEKIGNGDPEPENNSPETLDDATDTTATPEPDQDGADNEASSTGDEDTVRAALEELKRQYPGEAVDLIHRRLDAEMKRGMTPKLQKAAELERQMESFRDISPEQANWFRSLNQLAATNPQQAAAALQAEIDRLNSLGQPASPYLQPEYMTDTEKAMQAQIQAQQQQLADLVAANNRVEMARSFEGLEKKYGAIPFEEREAVIRRVNEVGGGDPRFVPLLWKDMFTDKIVQRARDETSKTVAKKTGMSPAPSSVANRAGSVAPDVGNLSKDQLWEVLAAQGGTD